MAAGRARRRLNVGFLASIEIFLPSSDRPLNPSLLRPSADRIRRFLADQAGLDFTYQAVGATAGTPPAGFNVDRIRVELGRSERAFLAAQSALRDWTQFPASWITVSPRPPLAVGQVVTVLARSSGLWWLNACRIVYAVDERGPVSRYGFAYGTLPGHAEMGEERFTVEWDRQTDQVSYSILAFSRPRHPLARLGYPWARRLQRRFARDSASAMQRAVAEALQ